MFLDVYCFNEGVSIEQLYCLMLRGKAATILTCGDFAP
jgi:hypothetical protein